MGTECAEENLEDCFYMAEETIRKCCTPFPVELMAIHGGRFNNRFSTKT